MSPTQPNKIAVVTQAYTDDSRSSTDRVRLATQTLDVDTLRSQFQAFMHSLQSIIDVQDEDRRPFYLSEIQFSAEIAANGEFKLLGTGVGVQASSTVTFVLQRSEKRQPVPSASGSTDRG